MTPLSNAVDDYLALRRRLGVTLHETGRVLTAFVAYAAQQRADYVTTALVLRWASHLTHVSSATVHQRCQMIRRFAQWRQLRDARTEVPAADLLPGRYRRRPPRLYREEDISQLLAAARQLLSAKGLRGRTYETLFGLLAVTGLRSSEVVALDDGDLDPRQVTLLVRRTKFGKSRVVPLHASTMAALAAYQAFRDRVVRQRREDALFVSERGVRITQHAAEYTLARVSAAIGGRPRFRAHRLGRGFPRLHDLRQHAGSGIMPGASEEAVLLGVVSSISRLPIRHNPPLVFSPARWPRREKTCEIRSSRIARRFRSSASSTRTSTRSPRIWLRAATPPRRFAHSGSCSGISTSG